MTARQKIELRRSEVRQRLGELAAMDGEQRTEAVETEQRALLTELKDSESRLQASIAAEEADERLRGGQVVADGENRERLELRSRARLGNYLMARMRGQMVAGAEAELSGAAGVEGVPLELWDVPRVAEQRAVTGVPGTTGINLDMIRPAVFAPSIAMRLGIEMPRVGSGTYASATISTSVTAAAKAKSANAPETAALFTVGSTGPKRVSARLATTLEAVAEVGQANYEAALRENVSLALSDELDNQAINGDGQAPNLMGILQRLGNPAAPGNAVATFDDFVGAFAGGIEGLWSSTLMDVAIVAGVDTYRLSAKTFRDAIGQDLGELSFASYAMDKTGGWWTNRRMPAKAAHVQQAILYRKGRSAMGASTGIRTAVCPNWGEISIDDVYSGSIKGERYFTVHVLLGDVILVQPDAYAQVSFRVST